MIIQSIKIQNILSIEEAEIKFADNGLVLVDGWNYDLDRANGAGKSAIFNALSFAIYDKLPRKISASEILRRGAKSGSVECTLELLGSIWTIKRSRPKGVVFVKDGEIVNLTQEEWESKLRLNYNQFLVSVYCAQNSLTRFVHLNDTDKKTFLIDLLNLGKLTLIKRKAEERVKALNMQIHNAQLSLNSAQSKISVYKESLADKETLNSEMSLLGPAKISALAEIAILEKVEKPDTSKFYKLEEQMLQKDNEIISAKSLRQAIFNQHQKLNRQVKAFDMNENCPSCGSHLDISDAKISHEQSQSKIKEELQSLLGEIQEQDLIIEKEFSFKELKQKIKDNKEKITSDYNKSVNRINELRLYVKTIENNMLNISSSLSAIAKTINKIEELTVQEKSFKSQLFDLQSDLTYFQNIASAASPTGAPAYVLESIVESLNTNIANYVQMIWPNASYELKSHKENSKGELVAKLTEALIINGKDISVGSLSGGEMKALSLCVDFALMDVLQSNFGFKINPTILDEPFDGLDAAGKEMVLDLLQKISVDRLILVVDHSSESKSLFSNTIFVEKRNDISTIKL